ncbi:MAG: CoA:oxalate CoA-transferase [Actinomycetia bacterium]|nr:CoA:oxalate CoA-transferase [Actinomycetes bacterium]
MTHVLAGPFGTTIFNDLGARVIKVEAPGHGDDTRTYGPFVKGQSLYFSFVNRGKESVVLNLKEDTDKQIFLNMIRRADVVTENFRPGTMDKLGFSYDALSALNPRLVYASSSGYGQTGPLARSPAYDTVIQAMSGIMSLTGFPDGPATRVGTSMADLVAGVFLFIGVASALYSREQTGKGARVDVAMFDGMLSFLEHGVMEYVATGKAPERIGNRHPFMTPFDTFDALDQSFAICAGNDKLFAALCTAIGQPDLAKQPKYKTNVDRMTNHQDLKSELEATLSKQPADHWLQVIHDAGVPVAPILDVAAAIEHPQTKARNMMIEAGGIRMPGNPVKIDGYEDPAERVGAPELDQHGAALREEFA